MRAKSVKSKVETEYLLQPNSNEKIFLFSKFQVSKSAFSNEDNSDNQRQRKKSNHATSNIISIIIIISSSSIKQQQ